MYGKPEGRSSIAGSKASHCPQPFQVSNKTTFFCRHEPTVLRCPPYDSNRHRPAASYSQYKPAIISTGDKGGDRVSIELPLTAVRPNPPNGEADGWLTTAIDSPAHLPLSHLLHLFLIPVACSFLYPSTVFHLCSMWGWTLSKSRPGWGLVYKRRSTTCKWNWACSFTADLSSPSTPVPSFALPFPGRLCYMKDMSSTQVVSDGTWWKC